MGVIQITCDRCERLMEVPESSAGQKVQCPNCGDVRIVPALSSAPATGPDRAAAAGLPSASGPEQRVMMIRRAMLRANPLLYLLWLAAVVGGLSGAAYYGLGNAPKNPAMLWVCVGAAVVGLVVFGVWKLKTLETSLEITNKRTIERKGILSRFTSEVRHQDIRNIQVTQSFLERLLGVGTIGISSAGQDDVEIVADDVPGPDRIRRVIDLYRTL